MRGAIAAFVACLILVCAVSAEAVEGRLVDQRTGKPIAGAEIAVVGAPGSVRTAADGRFVLTPDPRPPFVLVVMLPSGLVTRRVIERLDPVLPWVVTLDAAVREDVVVSGVAPSVDAAPAAGKTLVSAAEVERRAPANLVQALENVPGVSGVAEGQNAVPAVRGLARGRTLVLIDGSRAFSERRAGPSVSYLAPETFDRVDVARGPASVSYGSDAFGGVISVQTRRASTGSALQARFTGLVGGDGERRATAEVSRGAGSGAGVLAQAHYREAGDYASPDGVVPNSAWSDWGGLFRAEAAGLGGRWRGSWQGDFVGDSGRPRSDSGTLRLTSPFERSQRISLTYDRTSVPGFDLLDVSGAWSAYEQRIDQDRLPAPGRPRRIDRADTSGTDAQVRATGRRALKRAQWSAGLDLAARLDLQAHDIGINFDLAGNVTTATDYASIASARRLDTGVFGEVEVPVSAAVTVSGGVRFDAVGSRNVGGFFGDRFVSHQAPSGMVAVAVRPVNRLTVTVQLSRGFRDPMLSDRFYRGPVGRGFIIGNPDLEPETSIQFDTTARYTAGRLSVSVAAYYYRIADLIERYQASADTFLFRNRGLAQVRGVEIDAQATVAAGLFLDAIAQTSQGRLVEDGAPMDDIPPSSIALQVRKTWGGRVAVYVRAGAFARDNAAGPTEVPTPGYVDLGAGATWSIARAIDLRLTGTNLLNQRYYSSPGPRWVLAPGATGALAVVIKY